MGFLSAFGIDWKILAFQLINFGIIYFVLAKLVWPIILKALDKRQKEIAQGLADAETAKANLATADATQAKLIAEAKKSAKELIAAAKTQNRVAHEQFLADMAEEKDLILENAHTQAEREREQMLRAAQQELGEAVVKNLENFLIEDLTTAQKEGLTDRFLQNLKTA